MARRPEAEFWEFGEHHLPPMDEASALVPGRGAFLVPQSCISRYLSIVDAGLVLTTYAGSMSTQKFDEWLAKVVLEMSLPGAQPLPTKEEANALIDQMFRELLEDQGVPPPRGMPGPRWR